MTSKEELKGHTYIQIGKYKLGKPEYRQILIWAAELDKEPEYIIKVLEESKLIVSGSLRASFEVKNESFEILIIDHDLLPIKSFNWIPELRKH